MTGKSLAAKDLFKVKFTRNEAGLYWCPLSMKEFNDRSYIVAIKPSGTFYFWWWLGHCKGKKLGSRLARSCGSSRSYFCLGKGPIFNRGRLYLELKYRIGGVRSLAKLVVSPRVNYLATWGRRPSKIFPSLDPSLDLLPSLANNPCLGNVYSYEAVDNLNIKPNNWKDVLTGEDFTKSDIITIQVRAKASKTKGPQQLDGQGVRQLLPCPGEPQCQEGEEAKDRQELVDRPHHD